jgi:hypothetical protein
LNQEDINHLFRPITSNETEAVIVSIQRRALHSSRPLKKELLPILLKLFQEIEREGTLPNSLYEASITLIVKPNEDTTTKRIIDHYL